MNQQNIIPPKEINVIITFILCSRNDDYMGNPMWRLATSINYLSENLFDLAKENSAEIIISDWGSEIPISQVIDLTENSKQLCRFLEIPKTISDELQGDSPFAEVYAINAAAKRASGEYIARIDQDTLVSKKFLLNFFDAYESPLTCKFNLKESYMFSARKQLPFSFVNRQVGLGEIDQFIRRFGNYLYVEELTYCFWASAVGILMAHKSIWDASGGYDERLKYYWYMDVDLGTRLIKEYPIINIGKEFGYDFFHLEHFPISQSDGSKSRAGHRKKNPDWAKSFDKLILNPNGKDWGLSNIEIPFYDSKTDFSKNEEVYTGIMEVRSIRIKLLLEILLVYLGKWILYRLKYAKYLYKRLANKPVL